MNLRFIFTLSMIAFLPILQARPPSPIQEAYSYIHNSIDKFHSFTDTTGRKRASFDVYTEKDAPGNHFASTGAMGDWEDLILDPLSTNRPFSGNECLRITYTARSTRGNGWSAMYWQYPATNWGNLLGAYDLRGARELRGRIRGDRGGETVEVKVGGINRRPFYNPNLPYQDSCDLLTTGPLLLSSNWQEFKIDLATAEHFWIYRNWQAAENHFAPSGWMGDYGALQVDENWTNNPSSPGSCIRITYSGIPTEGKTWAGIYWQAPPNNWGDMEGGFDWTGATQLRFKVRAEARNGAIVGPMRFFSGGIEGAINRDTFRSFDYKFTPTSEWTEIAIDLSGLNLSNVIGGFGWSISQLENPSGCEVYLDDICIDKPITKDLSHVIGGLCLALNKTSNPNGCTFYIDEVRYVFDDDPATFANRMAQRGFPASYEVSMQQDDPLRNVSFVYDVSLTILALLARGQSEDLSRAKVLADALCTARRKDRFFFDGRLRNAYRAGDLLDVASDKAMLPGWWSMEEERWLEDKGFNSTSTGNIAWAMLALLGYAKYDTNSIYLTAVSELGDWVIANTKSASGLGGYTGGFEGWDEEQIKIAWKSTEHSIDLYAAFIGLSKARPNEAPKWVAAADHAHAFILAMWNPEQQHFWTGTKVIGGLESVNEDIVPLDVQAWALMTLPQWPAYRSAGTWVEAFCRGQRDGFDAFGFSFNRLNSVSNLNGVWFEGTAQMAVAYQVTGKPDQSDHFLYEIQKSMRQGIDRIGRAVPAASRDRHATGFDWEYHNRLHIGATTWYLLAASRYNPYWQIGTISRSLRGELSDDNRVRLRWAGDIGWTFILLTKETIDGPWTELQRFDGFREEMSAETLPTKNQFYTIKLIHP